MNRLLFVPRFVCVLLLVVGLVGIASHGQAQAAESAGPVLTLRRFALVVGANDGGGDRMVLRFANSDAQSVASVLESLGGVAPRDLQALYDPTPNELDEALDGMSRRIRQARQGGQHVQFVFYYSGHSDEQGLLLGGKRVGYRELRQRVQSVPADVRIAVLDSCASGAFTRRKGGTKRAPFLVSPAAEVKGHAFLTSSSMDEAAQESDRIGGSFFTHFFTTGLRGAADVDGDRIITLSEAYEFAFDETLARTEATRGGAQHAAYDIQLAGTGDLVMTDLRETTARLELSMAIGGRVSVRNAGGRLSAELYKPPGSAPLELALEPGRYQVTVDDGQDLWRSEITVARQRRSVLTREQLVFVPPETTVERGDEAPPALPASPPAPTYKFIPVNIGLLPPLSINGQAHGGRKVRNVLSLGFLWSKSARIDGAALAFGGSQVDERLHGAQLSMGVAIAREVEGVQYSHLFNHANALRGAQLSGVNHARTVERGFQGGVVNVGGTIRGAQVGLINVGGEVGGVQVGLLNFSKRADAQLGLLSFTREGNVHPEVGISDTAAIHVGLRFPARYTYSLIDFGIQPAGRGAGLQLGVGFGGRIPLVHAFSVDIDLTSYGVRLGLRGNSNELAGLAKLRLMLAWQPRDRLAVYGGPTLNTMVEEFTQGQLRPRLGLYQFNGIDIRDRAEDFRIRIWPGFVAGVRF